MSNIPAGCNVTTSCTKGLGEGAHHDIYLSSVDAPVLCSTSASPSKGADAVRFVQKQVCLHACKRCQEPTAH